MKSPIFAVIARSTVPVAILFAIYLLLRGHNAPGGGFVAGLVVSAALVLQALAFGIDSTRDRLRAKMRYATPCGLAIAVASGLIGPSAGAAYLQQLHAGALSTTLVFDIGVFLVVIGVVMTVLDALLEVRHD
jgi:multicomponent Na+:H+ antiporter subunit B